MEHRGSEVCHPSPVSASCSLSSQPQLTSDAQMMRKEGKEYLLCAFDLKIL